MELSTVESWASGNLGGAGRALASLSSLLVRGGMGGPAWGEEAAWEEG